MPHAVVHIAVCLGALAASSLFIGCGTDAVGIEACREIETARCRRAPGCAIDLSRPLPSGDPVEACIRHYRDACLHGIQSGRDPTIPEKQACVDAISQGTCEVVRRPELSPACAFIIPDTTKVTAPDASVPDTGEPPPPVPQPDSGRGPT